MPVKVTVFMANPKRCTWYKDVIVNNTNVPFKMNVQGSLVDQYGNIMTYYYDGFMFFKVGNEEGAIPVRVLKTESLILSRAKSIEFLYGKYPVILEDRDGITHVSTTNLELFLRQENIIERIVLMVNPVNDSDRYVYFISRNNTVFKASGFSWSYGGEGPNGLIKAIEKCGFGDHREAIIAFQGQFAVIDERGFRIA